MGKEIQNPITIALKSMQLLSVNAHAGLIASMEPSETKPLRKLLFTMLPFTYPTLLQKIFRDKNSSFPLKFCTAAC